MTADLARSHDLLRGEVRRLEGELADKNRRLEHKKRLEALGRVAAGVAHEFRNPLGGIRLTVDALMGDPATDRNRERLSHIRHAVSHLDHIVEDLLTFTRTTSVLRVPILVTTLLEEAITIAFPERESVTTRLTLDGPSDTRLLVDRHAMTQVLVNLLTNADQATLSVGEIRVCWGVRGERIWIEVVDSGPGIPAGEEERIFHPFHSLRDGGTGLGLSIVHSRVESHEGEISVVKNAWGGGSELTGARFRILLPLTTIEQESL